MRCTVSRIDGAGLIEFEDSANSAHRILSQQAPSDVKLDQDTGRYSANHGFQAELPARSLSCCFAKFSPQIAHLGVASSQQASQAGHILWREQVRRKLASATTSGLPPTRRGNHRQPDCHCLQESVRHALDQSR